MVTQPVPYQPDPYLAIRAALDLQAQHDGPEISPMDGATPPSMLASSPTAGAFGQERTAFPVPKPANNNDDENDGLPGHRLIYMYDAWLTTKIPELTNQDIAERYYHGRQWTDVEQMVLSRRGQPATYFNELRKKIDSYIGIEQRLRRDPKAYPRTPKHEGDCDAATAGLREIADETRANMQFSEAGRDYFVRGIGVLWQGAEKRADDNIVIRKKRVPASQFFYDPRSMEWDFSDAKFLGEWAWFDLDDAEELMTQLGRPDSAQVVANLSASSGDGWAGSSVPGEWGRLKADWWSRELQRVRLCHIYYRLKGQWRVAYFCGSVKLYDAVSPYQDEHGKTICPFNAVCCNVDETGERYGVVKDLIPIQDAINQRHSKLLWMMSVRQIVLERGAVDDIDHVREQVKRPDGVIELNPKGKDGIQRHFAIQTMDSQIQGHTELLREAMSMMQNYGPNPSLLGKGQQDGSSGRAILALQNAGMTEMSPVFERHREFKIASYRRDWLLIRQYWTGERWFRVMDNDKGAQFVAINQVVTDPQTGAISVKNDVAMMDIDMTIEEGPDTITMNEELMTQLTQLGPAALTPLGKIIITLSNTRNKDYLFSLIDEANKPPPADPEVQAMHARMAKLEELLKAAEVDGKVASAEQARSVAMKNMVDSMVTPQIMQQFPLMYGGQTFVEKTVGAPLNPIAMANAFTAPDTPPSPPIPPGPMPAPQAGPGHQPPHVASQPPMTPALPGEEPKLGQPGGLPLPGHDTPGGLMPPSNTRT